jgi:uncharacterized SAM-binding protein YcdF (DUF218 family)
MVRLLQYRIVQLVILAIIIGVGTPLWLPWIGQWLAMPPTIHRADVIAVFGGGHERTLTAAWLYQQGTAPQVWHTGWKHDNLLREGVTAEANQTLLDTVPAHALYLAETSSTWEDAQTIARLAQEHNARSILVVTSSFHSRRALCSLHHHLGNNQHVVVYYSPVLPSVGGDEGSIAGWWQQEDSRRMVYSEYRKLGYYLLHYGVIPWGC